MMVEEQYLHREDRAPYKVGHTRNEQCTLDAVDTHDCGKKDGTIDCKRGKTYGSKDNQCGEYKEKRTAKVEELQKTFLLLKGRAEVRTCENDPKKGNNGQ